MNTELVFEIVELALGLVKSQTRGRPQQSAIAMAMLLNIIQKAVAAYEQHAGEPINPDLIRAENPV